MPSADSLLWVTTVLIACCTLAACGGDATQGLTSPLAAAVTSEGASQAVPASESILEWDELGAEFTYTIPVCVTDGSRVLVKSASPLAEVGNGFKFLGFRVVDYRVEAQGALSMSGYPADRASSLGEVDPAEGVLPCVGRGELGPSSIGTRIEIGLRATGATGGGWRGVRVDFERVDGNGSIEVPISLLLCGTSTEPCH